MEGKHLGQLVQHCTGPVRPGHTAQNLLRQNWNDEDVEYFFERFNYCLRMAYYW